MALERASWRELTELVANHILSYINGQEAAAVMNVEVETYEVRSDRRTTRPSLDRLAIVVGLSRSYLLGKVRINKETFFNGTRHS